MTTTLFFKTNTTGLPLWKLPSEDPAQPWVVELACDLVSDGELLDTYDVIIKPGVSIPAELVDIHGISDEIADAQGVDPGDAYERFMGLVQKADQIAGFNISFDIRMMRILSAKVTGLPWENMLPTLCIMREVTPLCKIDGARKRHADDYKQPKLIEAVPILLKKQASNDRGARTTLNQARELFDILPTVGA